MPEPRYRGESWQASILRANIEAAAERRAEDERAEQAQAARRRAAKPARPVATSEPPPTTPTALPSVAPQARRAWWTDLGPNELNRYALALIESRHS